MFWRSKGSVRSFKSYGLPTSISELETARVYRLSLMLNKASNLICYRTGNAYKPMGVNKIAKHLGISARQATVFLNRMVAERIFAKAKVRFGDNVDIHYYINPIYFFAGKWLNSNLYFLFKSDLDSVLPKWVVDKFNDTKGGDLLYG